MKSERKQTCTLDKFATPLPEILPKNLSEKKYNFWLWRGYLRANLSVFISVWNLVKPCSMFTTQCTSSSFSYMCSTACHPLCTCNYILL